MLRERGKYVLHQRRVTFAFATLKQFLGAAAITLRPLADRLGMQLAHAVIAPKAEMLGKPRQRRRRNAGAAGLLAHRQQRDIGGMIDDPARRLFQLGRQRFKAGLQPRIERGKTFHRRRLTRQKPEVQHLFQKIQKQLECFIGILER